MRAKTIFVKLICALLMAVLLFGVVACDDDADENASTDHDSESSADSTFESGDGDSMPADSPAESNAPESSEETDLDDEMGESEPLDSTGESQDTEIPDESIPEIEESESPNEEIDVEIATVVPYYNEDGSLAYEECFDKDGVLVKKIEYYGSTKNEIFFDIQGKCIKRITYLDGFIYVFEFDADEDVIKITVYDGEGVVNAYTDFEYDGDKNMVKETVYNDFDEVVYLTFEYNDSGALIKETRKTFVSNDFKREITIEYDPESADQKHIHGYMLMPMGARTIQYEYNTEFAMATFDFKNIISYVDYNVVDDEINVKLIREAVGNGSYYIVKKYIYKDGVPYWEYVYDKDGVHLGGGRVE